MNLETSVCPKCNADATIKVDIHDRDAPLIVYLTCDKCKARIYKGTISREGVALVKRNKRLKKVEDRKNENS